MEAGEVKPVWNRDDEEEENDDGSWEDWADGPDGEGSDGEQFVCLFCSSEFVSSRLVFQHCAAQHGFDFFQLRKDNELSFYECLRLLNYVRSEVSHNACWSCGLVNETQLALREHLKTANHVGCSIGNPDKREFPWEHEKYLTPFLAGDPLLYSFEEDMDDDTDEQLVGTNHLMDLLQNDELNGCRDHESQDWNPKLVPGRLQVEMKNLSIRNALDSANCSNHVESLRIDLPIFSENGDENTSTSRNMSGGLNGAMSHREEASSIPLVGKKRQKDKRKVTFAEVAEKERFSINQSYFGSYSTFGIHREMLSDKIRTDAYQTAIMKNPLLLEHSVVMDLGCGTGILSLFAAKSGAKKVIAVDGSKKMALVAKQVAEVNGYGGETDEHGNKAGVVRVVQGMIEELDLSNFLEPREVDVLVSEWMGYCLLFESMLNSVLVARDRWLKPGGAILPDVAEMYVAGFGVGGTSLPFWESVYGFDMQCIGRDVLEDAAVSLIVDSIESKDVVTNSCLIQAFDLMTMKEEDVDFTASFEIKPTLDTCKKPLLDANDVLQERHDVVWCYGLVVWFDTCFTSRFCRESPVVLSTSPHSPKTHWSQTLLTFKEPICLGSSAMLAEVPKAEIVGTLASPAFVVKGRMSIARSSRHRSIDISLETNALGACGVVRAFPVQMFDM